MAEQCSQKDFQFTIGKTGDREVLANYSIAVNGGKRQGDAFLTVGTQHGDVFSSSLEAIYSPSGDLELVRPGIGNELEVEAIEVPKNITGLLSFIHEKESESRGGRVEREDFVGRAIAEAYPITIEGITPPEVAPRVVVDFAPKDPILRSAADE